MNLKYTDWSRPFCDGCFKPSFLGLVPDPKIMIRYRPDCLNTSLFIMFINFGFGFILIGRLEDVIDITMLERKMKLIKVNTISILKWYINLTLNLLKRQVKYYIVFISFIFLIEWIELWWNLFSICYSILFITWIMMHHTT